MRPEIERGSIAVLLLHGVITEPHDGLRNYTSKHITAARFLETLKSLLAIASPVSMPELVEIAAGRIGPPDRGFVVTFDDGFENNWSVAAPILRELSVPATFYITSDFIDNNGSSWIDRIEAVVEAAAQVDVDDVQLGIRGTFGSRDERVALLDRIRQVVKGTRTMDPYDAAARVIAGISGTDSAPWSQSLDQKMSWDQVRSLDADPLFVVGGHGRTHRILEYLDDADLEAEIAHSLRRLSVELGRPVDHFSYPEGLAHCYSDRVIGVLQRHGVICSPSAEPGLSWPGDDPFRFKRVPVV